MLAAMASCFRTGRVGANAFRVPGILMMALCLWSLFEFAGRMLRKIAGVFLELVVGIFMAVSVLLQILWVALFLYAGYRILGTFPGMTMLVIISCSALAFVTAATASYHERRMRRHRVVQWL